jgi:hypothetical protein
LRTKSENGENKVRTVNDGGAWRDTLKQRSCFERIESIEPELEPEPEPEPEPRHPQIPIHTPSFVSLCNHA